MTYNNYGKQGSNPHQAYMKNVVDTATPLMLIIMLYDEAIRMCTLALGEMGKNKESVHNKLIKAQKILTELTVALNMDAGGEVAENLRAIYVYAHAKLVEGNIDNDSAKVEEVLKILKELRSAWHTINQENRKILLQQSSGQISTQA